MGRRGIAVAAALLLGTTVGCGDDATGPALVSQIPSDVTPTNDPSQADMDSYSWQMFVALNWPTENGEPSDDSIGSHPDAKRVWETFVDPTSFMEVRSELSVRVPETAAGRALNADYFLQAGSDLPLVDRDQNFLVNEFVVNDVFVTFSIANGLVSTDGFVRYAETHSTLLLPNGSISVKAAWRVLTDADADTRAQYYSRNATISVDASKSATGQAFVIENAVIGLVGMHIVQKTPSQPNWIWSTFEHVELYDGANPILDVGTEGDLASNRPPAVAATGETATTFLWTDPATGAPTASDYLPPLIARSPNELPLPSTSNQTWQARLSAPWSNYRLVTTQWTGSDGRPNPKNSNGVSIAKNTTLETYLLGDQSISLQVPGIDTTNDCPESGDGSTLSAEIEQIELYFGYPETGRTATTWSSCFMCHQLALYKYGDADEDVIATDYSFVYKTILPSIPCESGS